MIVIIEPYELLIYTMHYRNVISNTNLCENYILDIIAKLYNGSIFGKMDEPEKLSTAQKVQTIGSILEFSTKNLGA